MDREQKLDALIQKSTEVTPEWANIALIHMVASLAQELEFERILRRNTDEPRDMSEAPWNTWILLRVGYKDARQPLEVRKGVKGRDHPRVWIDESGRPGCPDETWGEWWPLPTSSGGEDSDG